MARLGSIFNLLVLNLKWHIKATFRQSKFFPDKLSEHCTKCLRIAPGRAETAALIPDHTLLCHILSRSTNFHCHNVPREVIYQSEECRQIGVCLPSSGVGFKAIILFAEHTHIRKEGFFYFHREQASKALSHLLKLYAVCQKVKCNLYTCFARVHFALVWLGLSRGIFCFPGSTLGQVSLMSLALCMSQIVSFIVMQVKHSLHSQLHHAPTHSFFQHYVRSPNPNTQSSVSSAIKLTSAHIPSCRETQNKTSAPQTYHCQKLF